MTADDFGLSSKINAGIIEAHSRGLVTASSLLIAAPSTQEAIELSRKYPQLQIGLHLGIVESYSLSKNKSLLSTSSYLGENKPCLHADWKSLCIDHILKGRFNQEDWKEEFELQIIEFLKSFKSIPFINSTQHLHMMPLFMNILKPLCLKYEIPHIRSGKKLIYSGESSKRSFQTLGIQLMSCFDNSEVNLAAVDEAGKSSIYTMLNVFKKIPHGVTELMVHPGFQDLSLKKLIPGTYKNFNWETELDALCSKELKDALTTHSISLSQFPVL